MVNKQLDAWPCSLYRIILPTVNEKGCRAGRWALARHTYTHSIVYAHTHTHSSMLTHTPAHTHTKLYCMHCRHTKLFTLDGLQNK